MFYFLYFFRFFCLNSLVTENLHFMSKTKNPVISLFSSHYFFALSFFFPLSSQQGKKKINKKSSCPFIFSLKLFPSKTKTKLKICPSSPPRNLEDLPNLLLLLLRSASCSSPQSPAASHFSYWLLLTLKQSSSRLVLRPLRRHPKHHRTATPPSFLHPTSFSPTSTLIKTPPSAPPLASVAAAVSPFLQALLQLLLRQQTITTTKITIIIIKNRTTTTTIIKMLKI